MRVGLFIPCYIDQFYPGVAIATLELLEKCGCKVQYVRDQTCCGQPLANSGYEADSRNVALKFVENFSSFDFIVAPSGSCVMHIRHHYDFLKQLPEVIHVRTAIMELSEFLTKVVQPGFSDIYFPYRVGLHHSCHGLRGLRLAVSSELVEPSFDSVRTLLGKVRGLQLVNLSRTDECCGFGGTFAVKEAAVSAAMGNDRISDHLAASAEFITSADASCLMHLDGLIRRQGLPVRSVHFAEILNGSVK